MILSRGEISLWNAVITQALQDAVSVSKKREAGFWKNEALTWLKSNNRDFKLVCVLANHCPNHVKKKPKLLSIVAGLFNTKENKPSRNIMRRKDKYLFRFSTEEDAQILSGIKAGWKAKRIAKSLDKNVSDIELRIFIKPTLRMAAMTSAKDREIARRTNTAWNIRDGRWAL